VFGVCNLLDFTAQPSQQAGYQAAIEKYQQLAADQPGLRRSASPTAAVGRRPTNRLTVL
jgi:hypothetical protein